MSERANEAAAYADRVLRGSTADPAFIALLDQLDISLLAVIRPGAAVAFGAIGGALTVSCTPIADPMGLAFDGRRLAIGGRREITVFAPSLRLAEHLPGKEGWHDVIFVPKVAEYLQPLVMAVPLQLLAYHIALLRGRGVVA